jgi:transposase
MASAGVRGRVPPQRVDDPMAGALAASLSTHQQRVRQQSGFILATNQLDDHALSPQVVLDGSKGQQHAERGVRFLRDPHFLASALSLKKPERLLALWMVMTGCLLG